MIVVLEASCSDSGNDIFLRCMFTASVASLSFLRHTAPPESWHAVAVNLMTKVEMCRATENLHRDIELG